MNIILAKRLSINLLALASTLFLSACAGYNLKSEEPFIMKCMPLPSGKPGSEFHIDPGLPKIKKLDHVLETEETWKLIKVTPDIFTIQPEWAESDDDFFWRIFRDSGKVLAGSTAPAEEVDCSFEGV